MEENVKKQEQNQVQADTQETQSLADKAKAFFNKAKLSRYLGLVFVIGATIVLSLWQVGWNPAKIGWEKFLSNTALLLCLCIYGLFFGEQEGGSLFKRLITGIYQVVRDEFLAVVKIIKDRAYAYSLPDYIVWRYEKDYENTCKMKMLSVRVFDPSVCDLNDEQIEELRHNPIKISEEKHYSKLSEEQYNVVRAIKDGKVFVDYIDDYNFYLVEDNTDGKQMVTKVKETDERKLKISWQQRGTRVLMIIVFALILAGFFFELPKEITDEAKSHMTQAEIDEILKAQKEAQIQSVKDLLSRLSCLIVSIASGFNTARLLNLEDVFVLKYKTSYDSVFVSCMKNGSFVPTDVETKARKEYETYEKEQEEAKKNVVIPEPVSENEMIENKVLLLDNKKKEE